jgi:hypothetical protein
VGWSLLVGYTDHSRPRILRTRLRAKRSVRVDVDGESRRVRKGDLLEPNDAIGQFVPDAFELIQVPM